jgi:hypothetical protein
MSTDPPSLARTWIFAKALFIVTAATWVVVGVFTALGLAFGGDDGSIRCATGSYPASNADGDHRCFPNGEAPAPGYRPDPMTDYPRD